MRLRHTVQAPQNVELIDCRRGLISLRLQQVNPSLIVNYFVNTPSTKIEHALNLSLLDSVFVKSANLKNSFIGKFGVAFTARCSSFLRAVLHVLLPRSGGKVKRINAGAVVASVHHVMSTRNISKVVFVDKSVNADNLVRHESSIATWPFRPTPIPAISKVRCVGRGLRVLVGLFKKAFDGLFVHTKSSARRSESEPRKLIAAIRTTGLKINCIAFLLPVQGRAMLH